MYAVTNESEAIAIAKKEYPLAYVHCLGSFEAEGDRYIDVAVYSDKKDFVADAGESGSERMIGRYYFKAA